jgi:hypothetical protein
VIQEKIKGGELNERHIVLGIACEEHDASCNEESSSVPASNWQDSG